MLHSGSLTQWDRLSKQSAATAVKKVWYGQWKSPNRANFRLVFHKGWFRIQITKIAFRLSLRTQNRITFPQSFSIMAEYSTGFQKEKRHSFPTSLYYISTKLFKKRKIVPLKTCLALCHKIVTQHVVRYISVYHWTLHNTCGTLLVGNC